MSGVTGSPLFGSSIRKVWLLNTFLISFKVSFNQTFLASADNLVTSAKFLGSGMMCATYDPDYTKLGNALLSSFTTAANLLCEHFSILFPEIYAPFHSFFICIIWSSILSIESLALSSGCIYLLSGSIPRWEKLPSGYHNKSLKEINLRYVYCSQKHSSE